MQGTLHRSGTGEHITSSWYGNIPLFYSMQGTLPDWLKKPKSQALSNASSPAPKQWLCGTSAAT